MRERRLQLLLVVMWVLTRVVLGWVTMHDDEGPYEGRTPAAHDITLYEFWSDRTTDGDRPYVDFDLEYPPANLPFMLVPEPASSITGTSYETSFVVQMAVVDGVAFLGLLLIARPPSVRRERGGGAWWVGPVAWIALVPLLGPVALSRLDLVPAAALIWGIALARRARWASAGVLLGIATGTKVFAGLLAPVWALVAPADRRVRLVTGVVVAGAVPLLLFLDIPGQLIDDVWRYHSGRGIAMESSWGSLLLLGNVLADQPAVIELRFGAWEIIEPMADLLKTVATLAVVAVAGHATWLAYRIRGNGDVRTLAALSASTVVLSVGLGNVLSVQYVVWCVAAVAAAAAVGAPVRAPLGLLTVVAVLSHLVYPIYFFDIIGDQEPALVLLLVARNAALLGAGALLLRTSIALVDVTARTVPTSDPAVEEDERVPAILGDRVADPERQVEEADRHDGDR